MSNAKAKKKKCVFPITWSSKLGSVGRDDYFFEIYKYAPSSKITQSGTIREIL
jgi:hypothetical protein